MNSFNHFHELHRYNQRQRYMRNRSVTKQVLIVLACVVAIVLIQTLGRP